MYEKVPSLQEYNPTKTKQNIELPSEFEIKCYLICHVLKTHRVFKKHMQYYSPQSQSNTKPIKSNVIER